MTDDGKVRYGNYTLAELNEALASIDRVRFPRNYANLALELAARERDPARREREVRASPPPLIPAHVADWIFRLGWIVMALGAALVFASARSFYEQLPNWQRIALLIPLTGGWLMVNIHTLRDFESADVRETWWAIGSVLVFALTVMGSLAWLLSAPGARG